MKVYTKPVGPIGTNCYIVTEDEKCCVVIDPGAQADKLNAFLDAKGLTPKYILLTHGHYDHIGGVKGVAGKFGCKIVIGENDAEQLADTSKSFARSMPNEENYIMAPDETVKEGDTIEAGGMRFEVIDTPGHTRGGVTYRCGNLLFTGDTLFAGDIGRTDLYGGSYAQICASIQKLKELEGDYRVFPGHGPETMLEQERRYNPYMRKTDDDDLY